MKKNLYSMFDKQIGAYMAPIQVETDAEAIRIFTTWVNDPKQETNVAKYPEQFSLWKIGTYDTSSGNLETEQKELITGNSCKTEEKTYTIKDLIEIIGGNNA